MNALLQYLHYGGKVLLPPAIEEPSLLCMRISCANCPANIARAACRAFMLMEIRKLHVHTEQDLYTMYPEALI